MVVGLEAGGLGVVRTLARSGVRCIGLAAPEAGPLARTRACQVVRCRTWDRSGVLDALLGLAGRWQGQAPLFLTGDEMVFWVSEARDELERFYALNLPDHAVIKRLVAKASFLDHASSRGWPVPRSWWASSRRELERQIPDITFPCVLKPQRKNALFRRHAPQKAFRLFRPEEALACYDLVAQWEKDVVLQEWVEGGDDRVAFCLTYVGRDGSPRALFAGRKLLQWPVEAGNTALAEPAPRAWAETIVPLTERIWRESGFRGIGSIEYKMRPGSDEPVIIEPTVGRVNFQNEIAPLNGVDIPYIAYCDLLGMPSPPADAARRAVKLVHDVHSLRSAAAYFRDGRLTLREWHRLLRGRRKYMIFRAADPGPFLRSLPQIAREWAGIAIELVFGPEVKNRLRNLLRAPRRSP